MKFKVHTSVKLSPLQEQEARKNINLAIIGKENCNIYDENGHLIADPTITKEQDDLLLAAHRAIAMSEQLTVTISINPKTGKKTYNL